MLNDFVQAFILISLDPQLLDLEIVESISKTLANRLFILDVFKKNSVVELEELRRYDCIDLDLDHEVDNSL